MSGSYLREDLRPGAQCQVMIEKTYSGSGTLFTTFHGQLDPDTDEGKGIAELTQFFPEYDGNLGVAPEFDGEVVGNETRTTYHASDGECVSSTEDVGHWFSPSWGTYRSAREQLRRPSKDEGPSSPTPSPATTPTRRRPTPTRSRWRAQCCPHRDDEATISPR